MKNARKVVNEILNDVLIKKEPLSYSLDKRISDSGIKGADIGLVKEEVLGTLRNLIKINYVIHKYNKIKKIDLDVLNILRASTYEILFLDKIPEHATCNEAVNLVKQIKKKSASNFVNAILRNITRVKDVIEYPTKADGDLIEYLSVNYSMPNWICETFLDRYAIDEVEKIFSKLNEESYVTLLTNTLYVTKDNLKEELKKDGYEVEDGMYIKEALHLKTMPNIKGNKAFKQGHFYMQDESSMIAASLLDVKPGERVIDVCSSPGGKSIYNAIKSGDCISIKACDKTKDKIKKVKDNVKRLKLSSISTKVWDATQFDSLEEGIYDKMILDVPCSGLGLLGKKPDIRYHMMPDEVDSIIELQRKIFDTCIKYLKVGGELIYTTCTINVRENEDNVNYFVNNKEYNLEMVSIKDLLPNGIEEDGFGYVQLLPHKYSTDGFFMAKMKKVR